MKLLFWCNSLEARVAKLEKEGQIMLTAVQNLQNNFNNLNASFGDLSNAIKNAQVFGADDAQALATIDAGLQTIAAEIQALKAQIPGG